MISSSTHLSPRIFQSFPLILIRFDHLSALHIDGVPIRFRISSHLPPDQLGPKAIHHSHQHSSLVTTFPVVRSPSPSLLSSPLPAAERVHKHSCIAFVLGMAAASMDDMTGSDPTSSPEEMPTVQGVQVETSQSRSSLTTIRLSDGSLPAAATSMKIPMAITVEEHSDAPAIDQDEASSRPCSDDSVAGLTLERGITATPDRCSTPIPTTEDPELDIEMSPKDTRTSLRAPSRAGTELSEGSGGVDWDELEKTEEQEPRDEGSDEVG